MMDHLGWHELFARREPRTALIILRGHLHSVIEPTRALSAVQASVADDPTRNEVNTSIQPCSWLQRALKRELLHGLFLTLGLQFRCSANISQALVFLRYFLVAVDTHARALLGHAASIYSHAIRPQGHSDSWSNDRRVFAIPNREDTLVDSSISIARLEQRGALLANSFR